MNKIESLNNPKIKWAKKIIFASKNNEDSLVSIESKRIFLDLVRLSNDDFIIIFVTNNFLSDIKNQKFLKKYTRKIYVVSDKILKSLSHLKTPEGIVAIFKPKKNKFVFDSKANYFGLVDLQNPHNLGAIVRSCLAFNIKGLFLIDNHPNIYHFECIRSSMGYIFEMPILCFSTFEQFLTFIKKNKVKLLATANNHMAINLTQYKEKYNNCFLIGNEGNGLDKKIINKCDKVLKINISTVESLNAAVSASIIAFYLNFENEDI